MRYRERVYGDDIICVDDDDDDSHQVAAKVWSHSLQPVKWLKILMVILVLLHCIILCCLSCFLWKEHSISIYREGLDLTLSILPCHTEKDFPMHSLGMMKRMAVLHQNLGAIGRTTQWVAPTTHHLCPRDFPRVSGNLLGIGEDHDDWPRFEFLLLLLPSNLQQLLPRKHLV